MLSFQVCDRRNPGIITLPVGARIVWLPWADPSCSTFRTLVTPPCKSRAGTSSSRRFNARDRGVVRKLCVSSSLAVQFNGIGAGRCMSS
jgi:hypothetical protein